MLPRDASSLWSGIGIYIRRFQSYPLFLLCPYMRTHTQNYCKSTRFLERLVCRTLSPPPPLLRVLPKSAGWLCREVIGMLSTSWGERPSMHREKEKLEFSFATTDGDASLKAKMEAVHDPTSTNLYMEGWVFYLFSFWILGFGFLRFCGPFSLCCLFCAFFFVSFSLYYFLCVSRFFVPFLRPIFVPFSSLSSSRFLSPSLSLPFQGFHLANVILLFGHFRSPLSAEH